LIESQFTFSPGKVVISPNQVRSKILMDSNSQFHQHFMSAFTPIFLRQKSSKLKCKYKKALRKTFVQKKAAHKMLVKLTTSGKMIS
jgi:hypothetical protein